MSLMLQLFLYLKAQSFSLKCIFITNGVLDIKDVEPTGIAFYPVELVTLVGFKYSSDVRAQMALRKMKQLNIGRTRVYPKKYLPLLTSSSFVARKNQVIPNEQTSVCCEQQLYGSNHMEQMFQSIRVIREKTLVKGMIFYHQVYFPHQVYGYDNFRIYIIETFSIIIN